MTNMELVTMAGYEVYKLTHFKRHTGAVCMCC